MAAGDYVVRRNSTLTTTIPDAGSNLLLEFPTAVANVGSGITYASGVFTLGETGHFLVLCSDQYDTTDTTNNERINLAMELYLGGTSLSPVGYSTGYIRKSSGSQSFINFSAAVINVASTTGSADDLEVYAERIDNSTAGTVDRVADRSGITIIKLDDAWAYGRYQSSAAFTPSATDDVRNTADIGTTDEEDSPFTRSGNVVDIATTNPVLAVYSFQNDDTDTLSGRTEMQGVLDLQGTEVAGSWSQTYGPRQTDNCNWGGMSCATVLLPSSGDDLTLMLVSREDSDEDWFAALQLVELPSGTELAVAAATTGELNAAATNFTWDTAPRVDTAAFTHSAGDANIDVDNAGDYLAFASLADETSSGASATRAVPAIQFRVNTTDDETAGAASYVRGSASGGSACHAAVATGTLLTGLSASDSIYLRGDRIGTVTSSITNSSGAMTVVRLSSLFTSVTDQDVLIRVGNAVVLSPEFTDTSTGDHTETPTGYGTTASLGTAAVSASSSVSPTGLAGTSGLGTPAVTADHAATPTGQSVTAALGTASVEADSSVSPTGLVGTTGLGTPTLEADSVVAPDGQEVAASLGTPVAAGGAVIEPTGQEVTAGLGTPTLTASSTVSPTGLDVTAAVGTPAAGSLAGAEPDGFEVTAGLGTPSVTASSVVVPDGLDVTAALGTPDVMGGAFVEPTGFEVTAALGMPDLAYDATVSPTGLEVSADLGTPAIDDGSTPPAAAPQPYGEPISPPKRRKKKGQVPEPWKPKVPAPERQDAMVAVSGFDVRAGLGTTWQVVDCAIAPLGHQVGTALGRPTVTGMHNPTDAQIVEWMIAALNATV